jgi:hypothetical protein
MPFSYCFSLRASGLTVSRNDQETLTLPYACGSSTIYEKRKALLTCASDDIFKQDPFPNDPRRRLEAIKPLADAGWDLTVKMFGRDGVDALVDLILNIPVGECIEARMGRIWLPWSLLYLADPATNLSMKNFLGATRLVVAILDTGEGDIIPTGNLGRRLAGLIEPAFGLIDDDILFSGPHAAPESERETLSGLGLTQFRPMRVAGTATHPPLNNSNALRAKELDRYGRYVAEPWRVLHFATHAAMTDGDPIMFRMRVSTAFEHSVPELMDRVEFWGGVAEMPFAFFNSCYSGVSAGVGEHGPSYDFAERGVKATVGTSTKICNTLAADFASRFYGRWSESGMTVGEAFHETRLEMLSEQGNPALLVYNFHGEPDLRFGA